jgi:phosphoserine aminotransferase
MSRAWNFCAGPAALPTEVLAQARDELLDWQGRGMSVMEMSHRGADFIAIAEAAERDLRELLAIPANYKVLFLQGGATGQFAMVPMNLLRGKTRAAYLNTGMWSGKAIHEAKKFCDVNLVASSEAQNFTTVPLPGTWQVSKDDAYLHITPNETIHGVEFEFVPEVGIPVVADLSSTILSRPIDVSKYGLIYAGAQKNIGPAGIVVVIVREDLVGQVLPGTPTMYDYKVQADNGSMYNTPPTYAWYLAGLVFQWLKRQGGVAAMGEANRRKASRLYHYIDGSGFYANPVDPKFRSWMNIPFTLENAGLEKDFLREADKAGLYNLAGHRSVGGMRASLYNAVPEAAVEALIAFMKDFAARHG